MTKIRLKNYLKIGGLLLSMLFIISACQDESFNNHQETIYEKRLKRITLNELNSRIGNSEGYSKLSAMFDVNKSKTTNYQQRLESSNNPYILTDEIVMIEKDNMTFYTFKIESDAIGSQFYNLVVAMDEFNSIRSTRILEYTPSEYWLQDTSQPFNGTVKIHDNDIFSITDINTMLFARGSNQCVSGVTGEWQCGANQNHEPGHPNCTPENNAVTQYIITVHWGPCPNEITQGDSGGGGGGSFPIDGGNTGGGTTSGTTGNNNNNGNPPDLGENCIVDSNGNCLIDETTVLPPREPINNDECDKIIDFMNTNSVNMQQILQTMETVANTNAEVSVSVDMENIVNIQDGVQGSGGTNIDPSPTNSYITIAHTHDAYGLDGSGTFSVFSFADLKLLAKILYNNKMESNTFVAFLITAKGTRYALTINNATKLLDLFYMYNVRLPSTPEEVSKYSTSRERLKPLEWEYYDSKNSQRRIKETDTDNDNVLKQFLTFLKNGDAGISLFEANEAYDSFLPVELNLINGEVKRTTLPCNN